MTKGYETKRGVLHSFAVLALALVLLCSMLLVATPLQVQAAAPVRYVDLVVGSPLYPSDYVVFEHDPAIPDATLTIVFYQSESGTDELSKHDFSNSSFPPGEQSYTVPAPVGYREWIVVSATRPLVEVRPTKPDYVPAAEELYPGNSYEQDHYNFWLPVLTQLNELYDSGTLTVEVPMEIDHVKHFVFDALDQTQRTLILIRDGVTYRIYGGNLSYIALGHNHTWGLLHKQIA